jgi:DNA processing protein
MANKRDYLMTHDSVTKTKQPSARRKAEVNVADVTPHIEAQVGVTLDALGDIFLLSSIKGFGPQKFKQLRLRGQTPAEAIHQPDKLAISGGRGDAFRTEIKGFDQQRRDLARQRAAKQILSAAKNNAKILTYEHPDYPEQLYKSNLPIPALYVRGSLRALRSRNTLACVGSRKIDERYSTLLATFAKFAVSNGFTVVSGFALGADSIAHQTAVANAGRTICVMPGGLDRPFPPENRSVWEDFLKSERAVFVSEFPFGSGASSLNLKKRNKLTVALSSAVLIAQSARSGGAMNAYRFAREQRKPVARLRVSRSNLSGIRSGTIQIFKNSFRNPSNKPFTSSRYRALSSRGFFNGRRQRPADGVPDDLRQTASAAKARTHPIFLTGG